MLVFLEEVALGGLESCFQSEVVGGLLAGSGERGPCLLFEGVELRQKLIAGKVARWGAEDRLARGFAQDRILVEGLELGLGLGLASWDIFEEFFEVCFGGISGVEIRSSEESAGLELRRIRGLLAEGATLEDIEGRGNLVGLTELRDSRGWGEVGLALSEGCECHVGLSFLELKPCVRAGWFI